MTAVHAIKGDRRYRYYVSREREGQVEEPWRLPAGDFETMVANGVRCLLRDPLRLTGELDASASSPRLAAACASLADRLDDASLLRAALEQLDASVPLRRRLMATNALSVVPSPSSRSGAVPPAGYKVDISRGERIGRVSSEWFSRPDDERYLSLSALHAAVRARAERATARTVESKALRVEPSLASTPSPPLLQSARRFDQRARRVNPERSAAEE